MVLDTGSWMLWSKRSGPVLGTFWSTYTQATTRLADRQANGDAFKGERQVRMRVRVNVHPDGSVTGQVVGPQR